MVWPKAQGERGQGEECLNQSVLGPKSTSPPLQAEAGWRALRAAAAPLRSHCRALLTTSLTAGGCVFSHFAGQPTRSQKAGLGAGWGNENLGRES